MLHEGMKHIENKVVEYRDTAAALGSGALPVFSTPSMITLMEYCSVMTVMPELAEGESTVGTGVNIKHLAATTVGHTVICESELITIDGRRLVFKVSVHDETRLLGEGMHERYIINNERFMQKAEGMK